MDDEKSMGCILRNKRVGRGLRGFPLLRSKSFGHIDDNNQDKSTNKDR